MIEDNQQYRIIVTAVADAQQERGESVVTISGGVISTVERLEDCDRPQPTDVDCRPNIAVPGFIDIHVHGGAGEYVMDGTAEGLSRITHHLASHGVTGFLSTTVTGSWACQSHAASVAADHMRSKGNGLGGAAVLGVHLEGPYINPNRKGAQPAEYIVPPSIDDLVSGLRDNFGVLKIVTLAPEMPGAFDLIRYLAKSGIIVSIGHTDATYDQVSAGIDAGARHVTHCFNAMRQMEGREPGVVGAALSRAELKAELIWDNIHVHPASCKALVNAKRAGGVILISDGIPGAGMEEGYRFHLGEHAVTVSGGAARLGDGTLAGSLLTLDRAFANCDSLSSTDRTAMSSHNAAVSLGLGGRKGLIRPGYDADLVILDGAGAVHRTIVGGNTVYKAVE